jgi:molybdopterin converting factor small subunit
VARITVRLPSLLAPLVGGKPEFEVEAETLETALSAIVRAQPALGPRLFDEQGAFRQHVLCFHNGTNTRWLESQAVRLADGDVLRFLQAVSGG